MNLTELEERLNGPDGVAVRDEVATRLAEMEQRLRGQIAAGMPRNEFPDCQAALDAVVAAAEFISQRRVGQG